MSIALLVVSLVAGLPLALAGAWTIAGRTGNNGWIDAVWSFAVGIAGTGAALVPLHPGVAATPRQVVVAVFTAIWSLRLGLHIARRTAGSNDDPRYANLRREWGVNFRTRLFYFAQIQALAAFLLVLSILIAAHNPAPGLRVGDCLGVLLLAVAIAGEALADRQLARFRAAAANRGGVCDIGLWSMSRHPNYFFQWLGWVAYALIAIDPAGGYGWGWVALSGPALMYWLLVHASGIPPLETHMLRSRGEAFRAYQARVNAFWPGLPR